MMKRRTLLFSLTVLGLLLALPAAASGLGHRGEIPFMLQFTGTGGLMSLEDALEMADVDLAADTTLSASEIEAFEANALGCWPNAMVDARTQQPLGLGVDCLELLPGSDPAVAVSLRALSLFVFSSLRDSTLVTFGLTSVRPFIQDVGDAGGGVTHMTGSIPDGPGGIVGGTGLFSGASGTARVSGAVNLSGFPGELVFDCLWRLGVERDSVFPPRRD
jgi:hypothetical protein